MKSGVRRIGRTEWEGGKEDEREREAERKGEREWGGREGGRERENRISQLHIAYTFPTTLISPAEAVREAESDLSAQQQRTKTEETQMAKNRLVEVHATVREMIKDETSELEMIKQQCSNDLQKIGEQDIANIQC